MRNVLPGTYADFVLAAMPVSVLAGALVGTVTEIPFQTTLAVGALGATALTLDAMFR